MVDLTITRKQNFSCIYKIQSKITGRCYIGSAKHFGIRRRNHIFQLENKKHHSIILQNHVNKYGINDLYFEILEMCDWDNKTIEKEQYYIDLFTPYFNVLRVAGSSFGRITSEETRNKLRLSHLGKKQSDESKNKRRKSMISAYKLMDFNKKENRKNGGFSKRKRVICIETGVIFTSIRDAELKTGCDNISGICNNKFGRKSSKGLTFKYCD